MDLKTQRKYIGVFVCFIIYSFIVFGLITRLNIRIDSLEMNQIKEPILVYGKIDDLISRVSKLEKVNQVQAGLEVTVTAYNAVKSQTDSTPNLTASNKKPIEGYCGVSRDLEKLLGLKFGDFIYLEDIGSFQFQDRMHKRKKMQVDIFMKSVKKAKEFGVKTTKMIVIRRNE